MGYNAATGEFCDLVKAGIIDPLKVCTMGCRVVRVVTCACVRVCVCVRVLVFKAVARFSTPDCARGARRR
jgi:hypothetical protein